MCVYFFNIEYAAIYPKRVPVSTVTSQSRIKDSGRKLGLMELEMLRRK